LESKKIWRSPDETRPYRGWLEAHERAMFQL
jgi:hypothetical protein